MLLSGMKSKPFTILIEPRYMYERVPMLFTLAHGRGQFSMSRIFIASFDSIAPTSRQYIRSIRILAIHLACAMGKAWDEAGGVRTSLTLCYDACCHCIPVIFVWLLFIWCRYPLPHSTVIASSSLTCCSAIYCSPQLIVASFSHFTSILSGCCHHSLCGGSCCCHYCPKMLFPFCWAWQWNSCCQNCCTGMLYQKPLCGIATLLPRLLHHHAVAKAAASPYCCQSRFTTMLLPEPLHRHAVAATFNGHLPWCSCRHSAPLCCCCCLWALLVVILLSSPRLCFLRCSVCSGHGLIVVCRLSLSSLSFTMTGWWISHHHHCIIVVLFMKWAKQQIYLGHLPPNEWTINQYYWFMICGLGMFLLCERVIDDIQPMLCSWAIVRGVYQVLLKIVDALQPLVIVQCTIHYIYITCFCDRWYPGFQHDSFLVLVLP